MQVLGPAEVLSKDELLKKYKQDLEKIIELITQDTEPDRVWQLRKIQKADLYFRGLQFLVPQFSDLSTAAYSSVGSPITGATGRAGDSENALDYVLNLYRGYGLKFIGLLGQRIANVKALPDDPDDEDSLRVTRLADQAAAVLRSAWNVEIKSLEMAFHLWKSSTVFMYTPYIADGFKNGYTQQPKMEPYSVCTSCDFESPTNPPEPEDQQAAPNGSATNAFSDTETQPQQQPLGDQCPQCGAPLMQVPRQAGTQQFENGTVELHLLNALFITANFRTKEIAELPWLKYEYEEWQSKLKSVHPQLRQNPPKDQGPATDSSSSHLAAQVRDAAASPLGVPNPNRSNRWTYSRIWMQPHMFDNLEDDSKVAELKKYFPSGIKLTLVQNELIDIEDERLTDVWVACKPTTSEFLIPDAYGDDLLPIQDLKNDTLNLARLTIEAGVGFNFADVRVMHPEYFKRQRAIPNRILPSLPPVGASLADAFYQVPPARFSDQMIPWMDGTEEDARDAIGLSPWAYGGGQTTGTAHGDEIQKNASLQQIITTWVYVRQAWAQAYSNGVKQLAKYGAGMIRSVREGSQGYEALVVDIAELKETGWHFEADPSFPMTNGEQRGTLMWLMSMGPDVANALQLYHPKNVEQIFRLFGWTGLYSPMRDDMQKAYGLIHKLAQGKPTQQPQPDGSVKMVPSIPIDQYEDNHTAMAEAFRGYLVSGPGLRLRDANEDGYQNILARLVDELQAAAPQPPPPEPLSPRLSISAKMSELPPEVQAKIEQDAHMAPGTPPIVPHHGSTPGPLGQAPTAGVPGGGGPMPPGMPLPGAGAGAAPQPGM